MTQPWSAQKRCELEDQVLEAWGGFAPAVLCVFGHSTPKGTARGRCGRIWARTLCGPLWGVKGSRLSGVKSGWDASTTAPRLVHRFRPVDAGRGIALQGNDNFRLALHGLARAGELGGNALALPPIQSPDDEDTGARGKQDEELRHGSKTQSATKVRVPRWRRSYRQRSLLARCQGRSRRRTRHAWRGRSGGQA